MPTTTRNNNITNRAQEDTARNIEEVLRDPQTASHFIGTAVGVATSKALHSLLNPEAGLSVEQIQGRSRERE